MFRNLKEYISVLLVICTSTLLACTQENNELEVLLDVHKPFGFDWTNSREMPKYLVEYCQNEVDILRSIFTEEEAPVIEDACVSEQLNVVFLESSEVPNDLHQGSIRMDMLGEDKPLAYSYVYMHELFPTPKTRKMKEAHAAKFKRKIVKLYGNPISRGFYEQGSQTGFIVSEEYPNTCDFWITENFGILLCSERIVFYDGFEMSLSIIRLDNSDYGRNLKNSVLEEIQADSSAKNSEVYPSLLDDRVHVTDALRVLTDSIGGRLCKSENLKPLEQAWEISNENKKKLQSFLRLYEGDQLAEFVFEKTEELEIMFPEMEQDKLLLYLLKKAASQGSAAAMNEIGASLFYCYQGVIKNNDEARKWFNLAMEAGDIFAAKLNAFLELQDEENFPNSRDRGLHLLRQCSESDPELCEEDLAAILRLLNLEAEID